MYIVNLVLPTVILPCRIILYMMHTVRQGYHHRINSISSSEQAMDIEAAAARSQHGKPDFPQDLLIFSGSCLHPQSVCRCLKRRSWSKSRISSWDGSQEKNKLLPYSFHFGEGGFGYGKHHYLYMAESLQKAPWQMRWGESGDICNEAQNNGICLCH